MPFSIRFQSFGSPWLVWHSRPRWRFTDKQNTKPNQLQFHAMAKPNYGIDAPGVIRNLAIAAIILFVVCTPNHWGPLRFSANSRLTMLITGAICGIEAALMLLYAKVGKFSHRDRMLAKVDWKGSERVLDVGTGRGLLL